MTNKMCAYFLLICRKPRISRSKRETENKEGSGDDYLYYDEADGMDDEYVLSIFFFEMIQIETDSFNTDFYYCFNVRRSEDQEKPADENSHLDDESVCMKTTEKLFSCGLLYHLFYYYNSSRSIMTYVAEPNMNRFE